ncbi:MAG: hypothetical protein M3126_07560 [Candidatus Eremiobacteraeota bacterium]|nr:hypothetical protein [Candidatus Eremiobacteraeota bacterium]
MQRLLGLAGTLLFTALMVFPASAAVVAGQSFAAVPVAHPLPLDPTLADPLWATGAIPSPTGYQNLTTRAAAVFPTTVDLLYDNTNLYVGFHVEQGTTPVTATQSANDVGFGIDDLVGIGIDPGGNGSQVYYFETSPRGVRYQQASENARYKPDWQAAAKIQGNTWNAVMIIPLKALRVSGGSHAWRINFIRNIAAVGEHYSWAYDGLMADGNGWPFFQDARYWPTLTNLKFTGTTSAARPRPRAEIYGLSSSGSDRKLFAQSNGAFLPEQVRNEGIDLTVPITNTINFVGTANPDFSNVEIDQQTIAPQEFRRGLQEYRPFFSQGANFINANSASVSVISAPNLVFYSPGIGPFDRGEKIEGTFGKQSFGALNFRGYDQTTGNEFDDMAYGYKHAEPSRTFLYWADGVVAHHSLAGNDSTNEAGVAIRNLKTGLVAALDGAVETGSWVPAPGFARYLNGFVDVHKPNYETLFGYQDISPNYNPIDGFTNASDERGPSGFLNFNGSSRSMKNYSFFVYGDRFMDRSGKVHQADTLANVSATFKNGFSLNNVGPAVGILRSYALDDPSKAAYPLGCADPNLPFGAFTGWPHYYCGTDSRFNLLGGGIGYRDGTPAPIDVSYNEGPFGSNFLHLFSLTTSRPLGTRFSIAAEYDNTFERSMVTGKLDSQTLRRLTLGETLGSDSNFSVSLRSISGNGGFAVPGINLAASFHRHFVNGNDFYLNYGTPAANQTLNRLILKYVLRFGGGAGT